MLFNIENTISDRATLSVAYFYTYLVFYHKIEFTDYMYSTNVKINAKLSIVHNLLAQMTISNINQHMLLPTNLK